MINYEKAKEAALKIDGSVNAARDVGIGWMFENAELGDGAPFLMIKKSGEVSQDILDFIEEYMRLETKTDIPLNFDTGEPL